MCAVANPVLFRKVHQSIIKPVESIDSQYSECNSDNENNNRNSSNLSININNITEQTHTCSQNDLDSSGTIHQRSGSFSSQSTSLQFNPKPFFTPNINLNGRKNGYHRRIHSTEILSHSPLRGKTTIDSGTGDSMIHLPTETSPQTIQYEIIPVFGQAKVVFLANRYDFDSTKVAAYKTGKRFLPEKSSTSTKRNSNESKKSPNLLSRFLKPFKFSSSEQTPFVRHHLSHDNQ